MKLVKKKPRPGAKFPPPALLDKKLATLHNELARCHTDLSVTAMRVILLMASEIKKSDQAFEPMHLRVDEYREKLGLRGESAYHHLHQTLRKLATTLLETENPVEGVDEFQIIGPFTRIRRKGEFIVRFNDQMKPLLLGLQRLFCQIPLEVFFRIQGAYAVRFYLLCKSLDPELNEHLRGWRMTVEELRDWLQIQEGQYEELFNLRAAVLKRAQRELDEVADLSFRFEPITKGRQTIGWDFTVVTNRPKVVKSAGRDLPGTPAEPRPELTEEERAAALAILADCKARLKGAA
jgi:plasmid replication initiation protein